MPDLNLAEAEAGALSFLQGANGQSTEQPTQSESGSQSQTAESTPQGGNAPSPVSLPDDALVELVVGGQKVTKTWKEARSGFMLHEDYTRKRQVESKEVEQARELTQKIAKRDEAYKALVSDPENIKRLYEAVTGQKLSNAEAREIAAQAPKGDDLVTFEDIQKAREELKQETESVVTNAIQDLQDRQFVSEIQRVTATTINALLDEKKEIKAFYGDDAEVIIRRMARAKGAADEAELRTALKEAADTLSQRIQEQLQENKKESAVRQTKLTKQGIEPPGGTGIPAAPKTYGEGRNVSWGDIDRDAEAFLNSRLK